MPRNVRKPRAKQIEKRRQKAFLLAIGLAGAMGLLSHAARSRERATPLPAAAISSTQTAVPQPPAPAPVLPPVLIGDGALQGRLQLDEMHLEGDVYRAPLRGGGEAVLTLSPTIQQAAESVLERAQAPMGAIVVTGLDGRVLAFAGRRQTTAAATGESDHDGSSGQLDFALPAGTWAPAASVFKIVTSAALLSSGVTPQRKVCYHGGLRSVEKSNLIDDPRDKSCETLSYGLAKSQNAIIAKLASRYLDPAKLAGFARRLGFEHPFPFAAGTLESHCVVPDDPLEFARTAAGFWNTELSPLGGALLAGTVASRGLQIVPRIIAEVHPAEGPVVPVVEPAPKRVLDHDVAEDLCGMMERVVKEGTAHKGFYTRRGVPYLGDVSVAGKTGSLDRDEPSYLAYSWFVGFAPVDEPQYVISVLLGNPMKWHLKAHTAARLVLQKALAAR